MAKNEGAGPPLGAKAGSAPAGNRRRADRNKSDARPQIGNALRSVYDQTVGEAIPPEMLELLGRLG